jgi:hypothetical protein
VVIPKKMWREKRLVREECCSSKDTSQDEGSIEYDMKVNMVFELPSKFRALEEEIAEVALGAKTASFEKPEKMGHHMKPLFIKGYLEGRPVQWIMVDGGAGVNVILMVMFEKMGFRESDLMKTNTSLSTFTREVTDTPGVMSVELTVGSMAMATTFFVVDVKGRYNLLLGRDWIHSNWCIPSTLNQCLIQWIRDDVEVVKAEEPVCMMMTEAPGAAHYEKVMYLSRRDLSNYDYISASKDGLVPMSVKPSSLTQLSYIGDQ